MRSSRRGRSAAARPPGERGTVTAANDGTFRIAGLGTGRILLDAETDDDRASDEPTEVLLGIAEAAADVEVFVSAALSIRGSVVYDDGSPAAAAQVSVEQRGDTRGEFCDADGKFHASGLRPRQLPRVRRGRGHAAQRAGAGRARRDAEDGREAHREARRVRHRAGRAGRGSPRSR